MDVVRTLNNEDLDKVLDYAKLLEAARPKKTKS